MYLVWFSLHRDTDFVTSKTTTLVPFTTHKTSSHSPIIYYNIHFTINRLLCFGFPGVLFPSPVPTNTCIPASGPLHNMPCVSQVGKIKLSAQILQKANILKCRSQWSRGLRRRPAAAHLLRSRVRIPLGAWMFVCCECRVLSGRGLCDELITRPEESYGLWCVVCDLKTSRIGAPYIYDIGSLRVNDLTLILLMWRKWWTPNNASKWQMGFNSAFKGLSCHSVSCCHYSSGSRAAGQCVAGECRSQSGNCPDNMMSLE